MQCLLHIVPSHWVASVYIVARHVDSAHWLSLFRKPTHITGPGTSSTDRSAMASLELPTRAYLMAWEQASFEHRLDKDFGGLTSDMFFADFVTVTTGEPVDR